MTDSTIRVGVLVANPHKPEWGPGRVVRVRGELAEVLFRDLEGGQARKFKTDTLEVAGVQSDPLLDNLPEFVERKGKLVLSHDRMTVRQARDRFLHHYPQGFTDPDFVGSPQEGERTYKWLAHERFGELYGEGRGRALLEQQDIQELVRRVGQVLGLASVISHEHDPGRRVSLPRA